jgi:tetratricopeptide (TPR) repeat protein
MGAPPTLDARPQDVHKTTTTHHHPDLSHYLSLIQQYMNVFRLDNAIFLAERCVAEFPSDPAALYWLCLCYYQTGQIPRARHLLSKKAAHPTSQLLYLSAQCSFQLKEYARAEEALLHDCRHQYKQQQQPSQGSFEDWILQTTVRGSASRKVVFETRLTVRR